MKLKLKASYVKLQQRMRAKLVVKSSVMSREVSGAPGDFIGLSLVWHAESGYR